MCIHQHLKYKIKQTKALLQTLHHSNKNWLHRTEDGKYTTVRDTNKLNHTNKSAHQNSYWIQCINKTFQCNCTKKGWGETKTKQVLVSLLWETNSEMHIWIPIMFGSTENDAPHMSFPPEIMTIITCIQMLCHFIFTCIMLSTKDIKLQSNISRNIKWVDLT